MKNHSMHNSKHHLPSRWRSFVSLLKKWLQYHLTTPAQRHAQWSRRKTRQLRKYKYARFERTIIYYTNKERRKHGLWELAYDPYLNEVARNHSRDMAKNHFFAHDNKRHQRPQDRADKRCGVGENICMLPIKKQQNNRDAAREIVQLWMKSPGHRANILNRNYQCIGVGIASDGKYYLSTQNFCM